MEFRACVENLLEDGGFGRDERGSNVVRRTVDREVASKMLVYNHREREN